MDNRSEVMKRIRELRRAIREEQKSIEYYKQHEQQYPYLKGARKVAEDAIKRYEKEIKEWKISKASVM